MPGNTAIEQDERIVDHVRPRRPQRQSVDLLRTQVEPFSTKVGVDTTIVTGVNAGGCVRATVIDNFQHGCRAIVLETVSEMLKKTRITAIFARRGAPLC